MCVVKKFICLTFSCVLGDDDLPWRVCVMGERHPGVWMNLHESPFPVSLVVMIYLEGFVWQVKDILVCEWIYMNHLFLCPWWWWLTLKGLWDRWKTSWCVNEFICITSPPVLGGDDLKGLWDRWNASWCVNELYASPSHLSLVVMMTYFEELLDRWKPFWWTSLVALSTVLPSPKASPTPANPSICSCLWLCALKVSSASCFSTHNNNT